MQDLVICNIYGLWSTLHLAVQPGHIVSDVPGVIGCFGSDILTRVKQRGGGG